MACRSFQPRDFTYARVGFANECKRSNRVGEEGKVGGLLGFIIWTNGKAKNIRDERDLSLNSVSTRSDSI